jgi:hypothetical protein
VFLRYVSSVQCCVSADGGWCFQLLFGQTMLWGFLWGHKSDAPCDLTEVCVLCCAVLWQAPGGTGGALHVAQIQGYFILKGVRFRSNWAAEAGGAVWAASSLYGTLDISNCSFSGNKVKPRLRHAYCCFFWLLGTATISPISSICWRFWGCAYRVWAQIPLT